MAETIIMKGALEDHMGRIIYPDTAADQVMTETGKTVEERLSDLLAKFEKYLPLVGGTIRGDVQTYFGKYHVNTWGVLSTGTDGTVVLAENAYIHPANNTFHFANDHASMGARGIVFRNGIKGVWYFDTGSIATTAGVAFTPTLISITDKSTKEFSGNLNDISENVLIDCNNLANGPGSDWYFIQHISHSADPANWATQIAYALNSNDVKRRRKNGGVWTAWESFLTPSNAHTLFYSTEAPSASYGKNGDVWDVYV